MKDNFSFLSLEKFKASIPVRSFATLLIVLFSLLPASLGFDGTIIIKEAFAQFDLPLLQDEDTPGNTTATTTTRTNNYTNNIQDPSIFLLRGLIGSTLSTQNTTSSVTADDTTISHFATGRFRVFANESLIHRFIAEMDIVATDGSSFHNITITEGAPHRFKVVAGNETITTPAVPVVVSNIVGNIYIDGGATPVIDNVPMTLTVIGQTLAIQGININETRITDAGQRDIIRLINGQSIYGTVPR